MGMSSVYHFVPEEETVEYRLQLRLQNSQRAILGSAFFTFGAFQSLRQPLERALANGARITFLLGRFDFVTEPRAVDALLRLSEKYSKQLFVYFDASFAFHFKLAVFKANNKEIVLIGSLTLKGLSTVGESNLEVVGNHTVYGQANELLRRHIKDAVPAQGAIEEYRRKYNRAQKYRRQRSKWEHRGRNTWQSSRSTRVSHGPPEGSRFASCWITDWEEDKTLKKNIDREHKKALASGEAFPCQWVHTEKRFAVGIREGQYFVVFDNLGKSFGFAVCTRKFKVLNENDKLEAILFYRYRRGWKAHFNSKVKYEQAVKRMRFTERDVIGALLSRRLTAYLNSRR
jgi:hypothetical protein